MYVVSKYMLLESIVMERGSINLIVWSLCELEFCFEVRFDFLSLPALVNRRLRSLRTFGSKQVSGSQVVDPSNHLTLKCRTPFFISPLRTFSKFHVLSGGGGCGSS